MHVLKKLWYQCISKYFILWVTKLNPENWKESKVFKLWFMVIAKWSSESLNLAEQCTKLTPHPRISFWFYNYPFMCHCPVNKVSFVGKIRSSADFLWLKPGNNKWTFNNLMTLLHLALCTSLWSRDNLLWDVESPASVSRPS